MQVTLTSHSADWGQVEAKIFPALSGRPHEGTANATEKIDLV